MHFGFSLKLSDIDLRNIDLLGTYLDLIDTGIPSKYFVSIMSSRHLQDMSSRHVFNKSSRPTNVCWEATSTTSSISF